MAFQNFFNNFFSFPSVKADDEEEFQDPQQLLREECNKKGKIESLYNKYQECNGRVNSRSQTTETCVEELFDYIAELDHCVGHSLWAKLK